ncbi:MAG TPA: DUF4260 domain-containing protein [Candidatus Limnocylindrales bacterium]|jgi:hypothetical protein|nr:DUF4260 domain-containing protein [Candidatus Limnocylindrales bacterium]
MIAIANAAPAIAQLPVSTAVPGMTDGAVRTWLRLEGIAAFAAGLVLFGASGGNWLLIVPLILLPDISAAGFLAGPRIGTFTYNLFHNWVPGIVTLGVGVWLGSTPVVLAAAILIAHDGMDRAVGYGLKLPSSFHDTHLGRMGRTKA